MMIERAIKELEKIVGVGEVKSTELLDNTLFDATIQIGATTFLVQAKSNFTSATLPIMLQKLSGERYNSPLLLIAPRISSKSMAQLSQAGINSLDLRGNCSIKGDGLIIRIEGIRSTSVESRATVAKSRLFAEAGLKVIFRLLEDDSILNLPYRKIQEITGVSLGSINIIMNELLGSRYILKTENRRILQNREELLERWISGYIEVLRPKHLIGNMRFKDDTIRSNWQEFKLPEDSRWGGEAAAAIVDGYLIPEHLAIYGGRKGDLIRAGLRSDSKGYITIFKSMFDSEEQSNVVPKLLIYAELIASGNSRNIEAAQRLINDEL